MNKRHTISLPTKINIITYTVAGLDYAIVDINETLKRWYIITYSSILIYNLY
jgi:hypothetical protein